MSYNFTSHYAAGNIPWNSVKPAPELLYALDRGQLKGTTVLDIGCGTGSDAIELARRGYTVTAIDLVAQAIQTARARALAADQMGRIDHRIADILETDVGGPFDIIYDRGIYHFMRRTHMAEFLAVLKRITRPGTLWLSLSGNAKEKTEGPPRVHDYEIRADLGGLFNILEMRETRFTTDDSSFSPLSWATLLERKNSTAT